MRVVRPAAGFFVRSMLLVALFLALWPVIRDPYAQLFRTAGNCLVGLGSYGRVWYSHPANDDENHDTQLVVVDRQTGTGTKVNLSSRGHGYLPTAFVLALTLASPIPWRVRLRATFWSILWIHAYIALKLMLFPIAYGLDGTENTGTTTLLIKTILERFLWIVGSSSAGWMVVPLIIWASITVCRADWRTIVYGTNARLASERQRSIRGSL